MSDGESRLNRLVWVSSACGRVRAYRYPERRRGRGAEGMRRMDCRVMEERHTNPLMDVPDWLEGIDLRA